MRAVLYGVKKAPRRRKKKICEEGSPDDVVVVHLFEQADLADRRTRHALILCLESDLFQRDNLVRLLVPGAVLFPRGGVVSASVRLRARVAKRGGDRELTTTP